MFVTFAFLAHMEVQNWRTWGDNELYNAGKLFDDKTGRFKTNADGYFLCSTQVIPVRKGAGWMGYMLYHFSHIIVFAD